MFNSLKKSNSGKIKVKVLATFLVITLTFTNFALLGTFMYESIAANNSTDGNSINYNTIGEQNTDTNSKNVKLDAYLDIDNTSVKAIEKDINSEDLKLYVTVSVEEGRLEEGIIDFSKSNFKLKENEEVFVKEIETINAGEKATIELPIISRKDSEFKLNLLKMISQIKLTGKYIDENNEVTEIDSTKFITVNWTTDEITDEDVILEQEIITNKIYTINEVEQEEENELEIEVESEIEKEEEIQEEIEGEIEEETEEENIIESNKRIVQLLVKSAIQDNIAPVESTKIEVQIPQIGEAPEKVKVGVYNTLATNGKTSMEFGDLETSEWEYNEETGIITIEVYNKARENNIVSWNKECQDEFIITYIYDESVEIEPFYSLVRSRIEVYGRTEEAIEKQDEILLEEVEEIENLIDFQTITTKEIYKGNMYAGEETDYKTKHSLFVSYADLSKKITIEDVDNSLNTEDGYTYYKNTQINKAQAISLLGETGTIKIYSTNNMQEPLAEIQLSTEIEEEYITFNYVEEVKNIIIETSEVAKEGKLEIINEKAIKVEELEEIEAQEKQERIEALTQLNTSVKLTVEEVENNKIVQITRTGTNELLEPRTSIKTSIDKESISNQVENNIKMLVVLEATKNSHKLYKEPTIDIELPKEIKEVELENDISILYEEELKVGTLDITTNEEGNKVLTIQLEEEQTKYNKNSAQGGANIVVDLKVKAEEFITDRNVEIKTTCINDGETVESKNEINIVSKEGLVIKNSISVGEKKVEKINKGTVEIEASNKEEVQINSMMINNNGQKIENVNIIAEIPQGLILKEGVEVNIEDVKVSYTENKEEQNWKEEIEDFTKVKAIKIEVAEMEQEEILDLKYNVIVEEDTQKVETLNTILNIDYYIGEQLKKDIITFRINVKDTQEKYEEQNEKIKVDVEVTAGGKELLENEAILNGQVLRYLIKLENISNESISNVKINANIQNAVFYDLVECGTVYDITEDENGNLLYPNGRTVYTYDEYSKDIKEREIQSIEQLKAGEEVCIEYMVVAYRGNPNEEAVFNNNILITAEEMDNVEVRELRNINNGNISLKVKYGGSESTKTYSSSDTDIILEVKNLANEDLKNVTIKMDIPEEMDFSTLNQIYLNIRDDISISKTNNQIIVTFEKLLANKTDSIEITLLTGDIPYNEFNKEISLIATANVENDKNTYHSNDYVINMLQSKTCIDTKIDSNMEGKELKHNDEIEYTVTIKNNGYLNIRNLIITDFIQKELDITSIKVIYSNGTQKDLKVAEETRVITLYEELKVQESIIIKINAKVNLENSDAQEISNNIYMKATEIKDVATETLVNKIYKENSETPDVDESNSTYSISGLAWLDLNENGIREKDEKVLKGVKVVLLDSKGKVVLKENGEQIETNTTLTGTYKFSNLKKGKYMIAFAYDVNKYSVTKYQVEKAEKNNNSDVIAKQIQINGKTENVGITDTIELKDKDKGNIDIGLVENTKFDLKLDKYISKVVVTNKEGTTTYTYENANFTKVEIPAKQIDSSVVLIEYEIKVTNQGNIEGYVSDIIDYVPNQLTFNSETNPDWYEGTDGSLHNISLTQEAIEVGKSQSVKLVLTKTLKSDKLGTIENIAEIGASTNIQGIQDKDSVEANKKDGEDDMAKAELIISVKTGGTIVYISIVFISLLAVGFGIYIINKKVLKV